MSATTAFKVAFRIALVTVLFSILGFAVGGLLGIVSIAVMRAAHIPIKVQDALWFGAVPGGVLGAIAGAAIITISERRSRPSS
ncbi:MAG: hypothetical protein LAN64_06905 [Acidobacteriia bacterium]|nr:hypothetical protein [Terriglobia bacterium]